MDKQKTTMGLPDTNTQQYTLAKGPILAILILYTFVLCGLIYQVIANFDQTLPGQFIPGTLEITSELAILGAYFLVPLLYLLILLAILTVLMHGLKIMIGPGRLVTMTITKTTEPSEDTGQLETTTHKASDDPLRNNLIGTIAIVFIYAVFNTIARAIPVEIAWVSSVYPLMVRSIFGLTIVLIMLGLAFAFYGMALKPINAQATPSLFRRMLPGLLLTDLAIIASLILYFVPVSSTFVLAYASTSDGSVAVQIHGDFKESYAGYTKALVIPDAHEDAPVVRVADTGFAHVSVIGSITLPDTMQHLGSRAFYGLYRLENVTLNDGLETIGQRSFARAMRLETITLPKTVTTIGEAAFMDCSALQSVTFLASTPPTLGRDIFYNTHASLVIYVPFDALDLYMTHPDYQHLVDRITVIESTP